MGPTPHAARQAGDRRGRGLRRRRRARARRCGATCASRADDAVFGVYCRRWGVPLIDGGTVRLPRLIGHSPRARPDPHRPRRRRRRGAAHGPRQPARADRARRSTPRVALATRARRLPAGCACATTAARATSSGTSTCPTRSAASSELGLETLRTGEFADGAARFAAGEGRHGAAGLIGRPRPGERAVLPLSGGELHAHGLQHRSVAGARQRRGADATAQGRRGRRPDGSRCSGGRRPRRPAGSVRSITTRSSPRRARARSARSTSGVRASGSSAISAPRNTPVMRGVLLHHRPDLGRALVPAGAARPS